jgi:hypothetical protein
VFVYHSMIWLQVLSEAVKIENRKCDIWVAMPGEYTDILT